MRYLELKIQASEQGVEQITALLLGMGITEMSIDEVKVADNSANVYVASLLSCHLTLLHIAYAVLRIEYHYWAC